LWNAALINDELKAEDESRTFFHTRGGLVFSGDKGTVLSRLQIVQIKQHQIYRYKNIQI
jgi:hypothetical protein